MYVTGAKKLSKKYFGAKGIHCVLVGKDNGASKYQLKEETRIDGPYELGTLKTNKGGDKKSAKYLEHNRIILEHSLKDLVDMGEIRVE